jgi:hypothetical protein
MRAQVYSYNSRSAIGNYLQIDNFRLITLVGLARADENSHGPYNAHRKESYLKTNGETRCDCRPITFAPFVLVGEKSYKSAKEKCA